jgi:hypothetical protein
VASQRTSLIGRAFGFLTVLSRVEPTARRQSQWMCLCRCGREIIVRSDALTRGEKRCCPDCVIEFKLGAIFPKTEQKPRLRLAVTTIGPGGSTVRFAKD